MKKKLVELRAKRAAAIKAAKDLQAAADAANRDLTDEERSTFDAHLAEADTLKAEIERRERLDVLEGEIETRDDDPPRPDPDRRAPAVHTPEDRDYSLARAISASAGDVPWSEAAVERRASDAIAEQIGRKPEHRARSIFVPYSALMTPQERARFAREQRDIGKVAPTTKGAALIPVDLQREALIELLRNEAVALSLGVTVIPNLEGDLDIPRQIAGASATWLAAENTGVSESELDTDLVQFRPHTVGLRTDMTRRMRKQAPGVIEPLVREDVRQALGLAVDLAIIAGTGLAGQPRGILETVGIGSVTTSGGLTYGELVEFVTDLGSANALKGSLAYLTNWSVAGLGMATLTDAVAGAKYLFDAGAGMWATGFPGAVSQQVPGAAGGTGTLIFGNWRDSVLALWGGLEISAEEITLADSGGLTVRGFQDADHQLRHLASFTAAEDI